MKRSTRICLIALGIFGIAGAIRLESIIERRMAIKRADGAMVEKVEKALAGALAADAELTQRQDPSNASKEVDTSAPTTCGC